MYGVTRENDKRAEEKHPEANGGEELPNFCEQSALIMIILGLSLKWIKRPPREWHGQCEKVHYRRSLCGPHNARSNAKQIEKRKHLGGEEGIRAPYRGPDVSGSPFLLRVTFKIYIVYKETR